MKFLQRHKYSIFTVLIGLLIISASYIFIYSLHFLGEKDAEEVHFFIFIATIVLAIIAYYEFNRSHKLTANEFLLFISNRWSSKEIIKARQVIHDIFINVYRTNDKKIKYSEALNVVAEKILEMSRVTGGEGKKFIYLLNLLDYLETLSYFWNRGDLNLKDVQNTCGNNAVFFYQCFKLFIERRQAHDKKYYINFSALYNSLNSIDKNMC